MKTSLFLRNFSTRLSNFPSPCHITKLLSQLSLHPSTINLYEGIPNLEVPSFFSSSLSQKVSISLSHQYSRSYGNLDLVKKLSSLYTPFFQRDIDPLTEILVVPGSSSGIFACIQGLINPGDEVIVFEPNEQYYSEIAGFHGGVVKAIPLKANDGEWHLDLESLEQALTHSKTKLLIISSPQSPIGKIFTRKELEDLEYCLKEYPNVNVLFDASYEKLVFEQENQVITINNDEFWKRCVTVFSADKAFMSTGLNLAWVIGHQNVLNRVKYVHNISTFCMYNPLQLALTEALTIANEKYHNENSYYSFINKIMKTNMESILEALEKNEIFKPCVQNIKSKGGYSMFYDISQARFAKIDNRDKMISLGTAVQKEVLMAPGSFYYSEFNKKIGESYLKIDLCRSPEEVKEACQRLSKKENNQNNL